MALTLQSWKRVVDSKSAKTDSFKQLDRAVRGYLLNSNQTTLGALRTSWDNWNQALGQKKVAKTYQTSDRYELGGALDDIAAILQPPPVAPSSVPMTHDELIRQRDLLSDERSGEFVKVNGKWQQKIFTQQETNSCTCACATTFLRKLMGTSLKEDVFKREYDRQMGAHHDFTATGAYLEDITKVLTACGADVVHEPTTNSQALLNKLRAATKDVPILFAVSWVGGGAHAVMCQGQGQVQASTWATPMLGFLVEDPAGEHEEVLMLANGDYWARTRGTGDWSEGRADAQYGCIIGKPSQPSGRGNFASHQTVGVRVM
jgi:hypothetical protein